MANTPDFYIKQLVGELTVQIAILRADNDQLREQLSTVAKKPRVLKRAVGDD